MNNIINRNKKKRNVKKKVNLKNIDKKTESSKKCNKTIGVSNNDSKTKYIDKKNKVKFSIKTKCKCSCIVNFIKKINAFLVDKNIYLIILFGLPFLIMDIALRKLAIGVTLYPIASFSPRVFSLAYIILLLGITFSVKKKHQRIIYITSYIFFLILFLVNGVYYSATDNFFDFSMLALAGEGSSYFLDVLRSCNIWVYILTIVLISFLVLNIRLMPKKDLLSKTRIYVFLLIFLGLHIWAKNDLGQANFELTWDTWRTPRNIYNNFNDSNKCMAICGFYEYVFRDIYVTYIKPEAKRSETENDFLEEVFSTENDSYTKNNYTGKYKDKNIIFLQMEGIDNWLLTKETMPNTYKLLNNAINFKNHYSFYNGGGSTFNSEFAVNVGYMTPFTYPQNAYSLNKNDFPYSLANLLKTKNYSIKAFHMNSSEYYSRGINYQNWGYDKYFGLKDLGTYNDSSYELDRELILNETFYEEMFKTNEKFMYYIITYSNHLPFSSSKGVCKKLIYEDYQDKFADMTQDEINKFIMNLNLNEEDCAKRQARETDDMVGLLIKALKDNGLYDDTVIIFFTDHYLYTLSDSQILADNGKDINSNLVNHTPFFIWSADTKKVEVTKVTSQLNILPTVLNLLGISYNEKWYVGTDALAKNYAGITVFSDLSWYDGNVYVEDGIVTNKKKISAENLEKKNNLVEYIVKKNDLVLKYNYFKEIVN